MIILLQISLLYYSTNTPNLISINNTISMPDQILTITMLRITFEFESFQYSVSARSCGESHVNQIDLLSLMIMMCLIKQ